MTGTYPITLLFSASGTYAALGREAVAGALAAVVEVNADEQLRVRLTPTLLDPEGQDQRYAQLADQALRDGARHIVGTITSSARKEVIPVVERHAALLWYAFPYEGYEASHHALYFGASPNQHLLPLFSHLLPHHGSRPFIVGSNYIWGWEIARIARELIEARGGAVLGERYLPLGNVNCEQIIAEIRAKKPDFILSNLVGESLHAFLRAYHALGLEDEDFRPERRPVVSCNLTETDLAVVGAAAEGHLTASAYFDGLDTAANLAFRARMAERQGKGKPISSCFASVYSAVHILAQAIAEAGSDDPRIVREIVTARHFDTPLGRIAVDPATQHADLTPHLARVGADGSFHIVASGARPVPADPYLAGDAAREALAQRTRPEPLRVVK
ncbi:transporter substrate-binding protein [Martelella endophytica]|uniref:Amidase n=1 Tax=Martelella endophytica TaxID=1486262 RepID=A0A0D5LPK9_MAREN|nr:transporter substrate-binding protein [Martelella endophytica]AJY45707.1 hypothetical protein TM49_08465 [Martelella endophytica]